MEPALGKTSGGRIERCSISGIEKASLLQEVRKFKCTARESGGSECSLRNAQASPEDVFHILQKQTNETYRFISGLVDIFCVAGTVEQAEQPNYLAEGQPPLRVGLELGNPTYQAIQGNKYRYLWWAGWGLGVYNGGLQPETLADGS
eukprot:1147628-Pelagomonas_calceolata.AAC.3